ncbi:Alpha/Beta hydrolase protein, partial [Cunninghamella echinulata]
YSGYIKVTPTTKYFFWFFESRSNPDTAPLTFWLNGGPGCSSLTGLWQEIGPCSVNEDGTKDLYNERGSWNKISNMLFLDQPAGAGYSIGDIISSTKEATPLVYQFLLNFFDAFPKYRSNPFHFFGESYAGHYIPSMASYILMKNKNLSPANQQNFINLQSVGIGNSLTSVVTQDQYAVTMACNSSYGSVLNKTDCNVMKKNTPKCIQRMEKCKKTERVNDCVSATKYCAKYVEDIYRRSGRNIYDVRSKDAPLLTYVNFIQQDKIKELIGVPRNRTFLRCNRKVKTAFYDTGDYARDFAPFVGNILDQGIPVLIFAGDADYRGNWVNDKIDKIN